MILGRRVKQRPRYLIGLGDAKIAEFFEMDRRARRILRYYLEDDCNFYLPVTQLTKRGYAGPVFNLQTSTGDYTVYNISVHNCGLKVVNWEENVIEGLPQENDPRSVASRWHEIYVGLLKR